MQFFFLAVHNKQILRSQPKINKPHEFNKLLTIPHHALYQPISRPWPLCSCQPARDLREPAPAPSDSQHLPATLLASSQSVASLREQGRCQTSASPRMYTRLLLHHGSQICLDYFRCESMAFSRSMRHPPESGFPHVSHAFLPQPLSQVIKSLVPLTQWNLTFDGG